MNKIFIIAGTTQEANRWINAECTRRFAIGDTSVTKSEYIVVTDADRLKGYTNPHGRFVGNWLGRPDILDILQTLISRTMPANITLINLFNQINNQPRPTPSKLSGYTYKQMINDLSEDLSKHIDAEVMASLAKKINGGILANTTKI